MGRGLTYKNLDEVIIQEVKNYPTNLSHAFKVASERVGCSVHHCIRRYYTKIKKSPEVHAITCGSEKGFTQNVKNTLRDSEGVLPEQGLRNYMYLMKELLNLPTEERKLIINFFLGGTNQVNNK